MAEGSGTGYDKRSFLSGIAVGRQLKGWATGGNAGGGTGSLSITENGTYDVKRYAQAVVNVPTDIPVLPNMTIASRVILVADLSALSSSIVNINAKLVPESVFDVTDLVE